MPDNHVALKYCPSLSCFIGLSMKGWYQESNTGIVRRELDIMFDKSYCCLLGLGIGIIYHLGNRSLEIKITTDKRY